MKKLFTYISKRPVAAVIATFLGSSLMMLVIALIIGVNTRGADQLPLLFIAKTLYVPFILSAITAFLGYATVLKEKKALRIMSMILGILFAMAGMYTGWQTIR